MTAIAVPLTRTRRPGVGTVYVWELRKLRAQKRTYIGLGAALLVPMIFIVALLTGDGGPEGIPFGRYVRESGLAIPLVQPDLRRDLVLPADHRARRRRHRGRRGRQRDAEDDPHALGRALAGVRRPRCSPRSPTRSPALVVYVGVGLFVGGLIWGFDPLVSLSGTPISVSRGLTLIGASGARLLPADDRRRLDRAAALDADPQLRRGGRRRR